MLVLTRKKNETVIITLPDGRTIVAVVAETRGDKVRLGFIADDDIKIHRSEVHRAIRAESEKVAA